MELLSLLAFLLAAVGSQINARPHFSNKVSNSTQKSLSSGSILEQLIRDKINLPEVPRPIPTRFVIKWYVKETWEKISRKNTRFGEKVDAIRFSNALGHSKQDTTYKLIYTFDLSGIHDRYKEIFGHDLYFRAPTKILKDHGSPAYFHVSVWEAGGRLLNSSVLAPVTGNDYRIVIDRLSGLEYPTQNKIDLVVDMGCEVHSIDKQTDRSNASIATYGYMPPKKMHYQHFLRSRRNKFRLTRSVGEEQPGACCSLHPHKQLLGDKHVGSQETVLMPIFVTDYFCRVNKGYRRQYTKCKTVSEPEITSVLYHNSHSGQVGVRPVKRNVGRSCYCE